MDDSKKNIYYAALSILIVLFLIAAATAVYFYKQFNELKRNPQKFVQEEVQNLVAQVGKLVVLPEGETPTVATVSDPEKLKDQPFFAKAKVGDKVLIYPNSQKAILYDPVRNIIIEVAPVNIGPAQAVTAP